MILISRAVDDKEAQLDRQQKETVCFLLRSAEPVAVKLFTVQAVNV